MGFDPNKASYAAFAETWLSGLCEKEGVEMMPERRTALWSGIQSLSTAPLSERTITGLGMLLQDSTLKSALHPYTLEGPHGRLLDSDRDDLALSDIVCFEMEELMTNERAVAPVITYIFKRLENRFDGRPTLLILDEAWLFLDHPIFAARIREWLKTLRKKNVAVKFALQYLADISRSTIAPTLIENCPTRFFLPNERALEPQQRKFYEAFGLNDRQISIIANAIPKRDYYYQSPLGSRLFELGSGPVAKAMCGSSTPEDQKIISACQAQTDAGFLQAFLTAKGLDWSINVARQWPGYDLETASTEHYATVAAE